MNNKYKAKKQNLDLLLRSDNLIEPVLKQYSEFCNEISIKLDQTLQSHNLTQFKQYNLLTIQKIMSGKVRDKIKILLYCLYRYDDQNDKLAKDLKIKRIIRSNQVKQDPINQQTLGQIFEIVQKLRDNETQQMMIKQIQQLRHQNYQQKIIISELQIYKTSIELDFKQRYYDNILQLNDLINRSCQKIQINPQMRQKLQGLETKDRQNEAIIIQLKKQINLHIQIVEDLKKDIVLAQAQVYNLKKELKDTIKAMQKKINSLQNYIKQYSESQKLRNQGALVQFFNQNIKKIHQIDQNFKQKHQIVDYFKYISRSLLTSSQILINYPPIRLFLTQQIQKHAKKPIIKTNLLYKFDKFNNPFGNYLNQIESSFIVLFRLQNNRICGGYCSGIKQLQSSFLFTYLNLGKVFNKNPKCLKDNGWIYSNNSLVLGTGQIIVMNKSNSQFKLNINIFGTKYFEVNRMSDLVQEHGSNNIIKFQEMEIHSIMF